MTLCPRCKGAVARVNGYFNSLAQPHRDAAHAMKRSAAKVGDPYPDWFAQEAELRDITPAALADLVLTKHDPLEYRELHRQRALMAVESARTPSELATVSFDKI